MEPNNYLSALRRHAWVVAASVVAAIVVAVATIVFADIKPSPRPYEATSSLLGVDGDELSPALHTIAALATIGAVPRRAAAALGYSGDPLDLAKKVLVEVNDNTKIISITARSLNAGRAKQIADEFAAALVASVLRGQEQAITEEAQEIRLRIEQHRKEISELDRQIADAPPSEALVITEERNARAGLLSVAYQRLADVGGAPTDPLQIVQRARPQAAGGVLITPQSEVLLIGIAGVLGLIAGVILALVVERFDSRIRTRLDAESHFGLPVLAEIPFIPRRARQRQPIQAESDARSFVADSFRLLGAGMFHPPRHQGLVTARARRGQHSVSQAQDVDANDAGPESQREGPKTILVTSAGPAEGKTTVVANLAAIFTELQKRVLILSCNFRRPEIDALLSVPNGRGLSDELVSGNGHGVLNGLVLNSRLRGVRIVPSGSVPERPAELLGSDRMKLAIQESREQADIVLIDTSPVLTTSDVIPLLDEVDAVLVVARSGMTTGELAERTSQMLKRFTAPVVGVALNAVRELGLPKEHRRHNGYHQPAEGASTGSVDMPRSAREVSSDQNERGSELSPTNGFISESKKCPECREPIHDTRKTCPNCGYEYQEEDYANKKADEEFVASSQIDEHGGEIVI